MKRRRLTGMWTWYDPWYNQSLDSFLGSLYNIHIQSTVVDINRSCNNEEWHTVRFLLYRQWHTVRFCWYNERWDSEKWYILHIASFYNVQIFSTDSFNYLHTVQCTRYHTYTVEVFLKILCFCLDFVCFFVRYCLMSVFPVIHSFFVFFSLTSSPSSLLVCFLTFSFSLSHILSFFAAKAALLRPSKWARNKKAPKLKNHLSEKCWVWVLSRKKWFVFHRKLLMDEFVACFLFYA